MRLTRSHGLGNDYLVLETGDTLTPDLVQRLCNRHTGVGSDGILEPVPPEGADFGVRIWNPDGSVAEKSGNGLRIFARWLVDTRNAPPQFSVWTGFDVVECTVHDDVITIEMGAATFTPDSVPVLADEPLIDAPLALADVTLNIVAVSVGNPHCVVFREEDLDTLPWRTWGAEIESHPRFPNRTNVQFARVVNGATLEIRIWERGAGETQASGSSSCAAAAAAVRTDRLQPGAITVHMPGGDLHVTVRPDWSIVLSGPVEVVGVIEVDPRWCGAT